MKIIWCGLKIKENFYVLVNQFHGNFCSKTLCCRKITSVFRYVKWCLNASRGLKGLKHTTMKSHMLLLLGLHDSVHQKLWLELNILVCVDSPCTWWHKIDRHANRNRWRHKARLLPWSIRREGIGRPVCVLSNNKHNIFFILASKSKIQ